VSGYFYKTPAVRAYVQRTGDKVRCAACGASYWSKVKAVTPWGSLKVKFLLLTCGTCGAKDAFAPGSIFTEH
jgi:hypothetical protein